MRLIVTFFGLAFFAKAAVGQAVAPCCAAELPNAPAVSAAPIASMAITPPYSQQPSFDASLFRPAQELATPLAPDAGSAPSEAPGSTDDDQPTLMRSLAKRGLHDIENERWNAYSQFTYIYAWKKAFPAPYTNLNGSINSLFPTAEQSFTGSATLFAGARLWRGGEAYAVPELISERPLSQLKGLGGAIQDFELQKGGAEKPTLYLSRAYLRQTFELGGGSQPQESGPMQLGTAYDRRRLVFEVGNFSILDFFDKSAFDIDPRQGFFNLAFMTYAAYDFASDARGYSWGAVSEFYWDDWSVRVGRITPPKNPNQLPIDWRLFKFYGDQLEAERDHKLRGQEGSLRVLGFRNREAIGRFSDAVAAFEANPQENATTCPGFNYGSANANAPDLCWARKPNTKVGIGVFGEQYLARDIGVFARAMDADGKTEVDAYTSTDRSADAGVLAKGTLWSRPNDVTGVGVHLGWISKAHADYLGLGGIDGFVGDGKINSAPEEALDLFYSWNFRKGLWLAGDYQRIGNPGFNADRGPVDLFLVKIHGEF